MMVKPLNVERPYFRVKPLRRLVHIAVLVDIRRMAIERIRAAIARIREQPFYR